MEAHRLGHLEVIAAELSLEEGSLVVKAATRPQCALDDLLIDVTADNLHGEIDTGPLAGNEVW